MTYAQEEFVERGRRVFAPKTAQNGCVKEAITKASKALNIRWHRARDLLRGKAVPSVPEMDALREMDGVWCRQERQAKPDLMERMHDKIDALYHAYVERRERKRAQKDFIQRIAAE